MLRFDDLVVALIWPQVILWVQCMDFSQDNFDYAGPKQGKETSLSWDFIKHISNGLWVILTDDLHLIWIMLILSHLCLLSRCHIKSKGFVDTHPSLSSWWHPLWFTSFFLCYQSGIFIVLLVYKIHRVYYELAHSSRLLWSNQQTC